MTESVSATFWILWIVASIVAIVMLFRKKWKGFGISMALGFAALVVEGQLSSAAGSTAGANQVTTSSDSAQNSAPSPKPDLHDKRVAYHDYWNATVGDLAMAYVGINYAVKELQAGDTVQASALLKTAQKSADMAKEATTTNVPADWNNDDIGSQLFSASDKLSDALGKARGYLDDERASEMSDAIEEAGEARDAVDSATHNARISYESMGGRWQDLESMQDQATQMISFFDSFSK